MLALIALLCFFAGLFKPEIGGVSMLFLGLCFLAGSMLFDWAPWRRNQ
ncbi:MAG TPA: hypothetical protein VFR23_10350 [Jiangellaceae bacterium]|nr:hypothetical protein [Jiangellaceae bacterium]